MSNHRVRSLEEVQPPYEEFDLCPQEIKKTGNIRGYLYVAGQGPTDSDVMFVATAVQEEEAAQSHIASYGVKITQKAEYLKGPTGLVKDIALRSGVDLDKHYFTALVKWLLPREIRGKPRAEILRWGKPALMSEISRNKPKVIVCMGKPVFDMLSDVKLSQRDAHGGWFWSTEANAHIILMHPPSAIIPRPELHETFRVDFTEVKRKLDILKFGDINDLPINYEVIRDMEGLKDWVGRMEEEGHDLFSVDCEWHKKTHVGGNLRMIQFCWSDTEAAVIRFRNENNEFDFDFNGSDGFRLASEADSVGATAGACGADAQQVEEHVKYAQIGQVLGRIMNRPQTKFIGHHFSADAPWMEHWLKIDTYQKCHTDTEFAQQVVDESSELGLERGIAMKYTTLGKYNTDLILWKKKNGKLCQDGYGFIPDNILIPYAVRDVIAPFRAVPLIRKQMDAQKLTEYYDKIVNPFVSDVFTNFTMVGLPMDIPRMDDMRKLFTYVNDRLESELQKDITRRARVTLMTEAIRVGGGENFQRAGHVLNVLDTEGYDAAWKELKQIVPLAEVGRFKVILEHLFEAPDFKRTSSKAMCRWLFDVEGLTPIKSTSQRAKGLPSMSWEKVQELPEDRRKLYHPAADKQTIQILADQLPLLNRVLDISAVGTICRSFLKEPTYYIDDDGIECVDEHGLHQWIADDGRIHGMYSTTETGRPRSWKPNTLNWPSYMNERIALSVARIIEQDYEAGTLPEELEKWVGKTPPSIRSCVKAPEGYCFVESDYRTAEMFGLAVISGDQRLIDILTMPDPEWVKVKKNDHKIGAVRVAFAPTRDTGIPQEHQDPKFLMSAWDGNKKICDFTEDDLLRDEDGNVVHASFDIHWSLAERTYERPREMMMAKVERAAGKVGNFSSAYGATGLSLERKIEADTGVKPAPGTGEKLLESIAIRQPRATEFLEEMAKVPEEKGFYRAASGRIRHCTIHDRNSGVNWRTRNSINSAQGRELRNFPMQESVGSTAARAGINLTDVYRKMDMKARVVAILYDSVVTLCPLEERHIVARLHEVYMSEQNVWDYKDDLGERQLKYLIDNDLVWRWSTKPSDEDLSLLESEDFHPTPREKKWMEQWGKAAA